MPISGRDVRDLLINLKKASSQFGNAYNAGKRSGSIVDYEEYLSAREVLCGELEEATNMVPMAGRRGFDVKDLNDRAWEAEEKMQSKVLTEPVGANVQGDAQDVDGVNEDVEWYGCYNHYVTLFDWTTFFAFNIKYHLILNQKFL